MIVSWQEVSVEQRLDCLKGWLRGQNRRLGLITSIDGKQLITLVLDPQAATAECWHTPLDSKHYPSLTPARAQCHWFEKAVWDLFGLCPDGHPRLKNLLLHEPYAAEFTPLADASLLSGVISHPRRCEFLKVHGEGVYEIPVGPIHAGIIEPGHFRLSCLGEIIVNLEIRLGFVHRGLEKRLTEIPWRQACFVAESACSDTAIANSLAHAQAIESLCRIQAPLRAQYLRVMALEIERAAMHIVDLSGLAADIGAVGVAATLSRLRGDALRLAELLTGNRFQRWFICPGGVRRDPARRLEKIHDQIRALRFSLEAILSIYIANPVVQERFEGVGRISPSLAQEFGLVGVTARASGIAYDVRRYYAENPQLVPAISMGNKGDVMDRARVRIAELYKSLELVSRLSKEIPEGPVRVDMPERLPKDGLGIGIVEAFRGELIHLIFSNDQGGIKRYVVKDPSFNNWTAVSIAVRNNLVADFPICNKSFGLSYSGHDL